MWLLDALFALFKTLIGGAASSSDLSNSSRPYIPPSVRAKMQQQGITDDELLGAFNSHRIEKGRAPGSTIGIAEYQSKVVGAVYKKNFSGPQKWVIIGCFCYYKKSSDPLTARRYWNVDQRPILKSKKKFNLFG